jgi:predicted AAA+ superfamily ATPase
LQADPEETLAATLRRRPNLTERYLEIGGFPEHVWSEDLSEVRRRLRSDIADRAILRDLAGFVEDVQRVKDLFVYLLQDSGAIFDAAARGRDLDADPRAVRKWEGLIRDTLLVLPLERHTRQPTASLRAKAKLYAADPGLVTAFASSPSPEVRGRAFEAAVFRHLREIPRELHYFRQDESLEIDFLFAGAEGLVGVEVTSATRLRPEKVEKLRRAGRAAGADRLVLIHGGFVEETAEGVKAVALSRFLRDPEEAILQ